jgi:hypothetical protein
MVVVAGVAGSERPRGLLGSWWVCGDPVTAWWVGCCPGVRLMLMLAGVVERLVGCGMLLVVVGGRPLVRAGINSFVVGQS